MYRPQSYGSDKPPPGTPVNRRHPIGRRLVASFIFNKPFTRETGGWRFYDSSGSDLTALYTRSNADTAWTCGQTPGGAPLFKGGADGGGATWLLSQTLSAIGPGGLTATSLSVIGRYIKVAGNPNLETFGNAIISTRNAAGDVAGFHLGSDATSIYWIVAGSGLQVGTNPSFTTTTGIPYTLAGTFQRDTSVATFAGYWTAYLNGALLSINGYTSAGSFAGTFSDNAPSFNYRSSSGVADKIIDYVHIFNDCLDPGEVAQVTREPYCMYFASPVRNIGRVVKAAAAATSGLLLRRRRQMAVSA